MRQLVVKAFFFSMIWVIASNCMTVDHDSKSDKPSHIHKRKKEEDKEIRKAVPNDLRWLGNALRYEGGNNCGMLCVILTLGLCCCCKHYLS